MQGRARLEVGARARTLNICLMVVTLVVSKLSGWLNADASCRVERRAYDAERGVGREAGGRGPAAAHTRHARGEGAAVEAPGACPVLDTPAELLVACREQATFRALSSNADYSSVFGVWRGSRVRLPTNVT